MTLLMVAAVATLLMALAHLVIGWSISNRLHRGVLTPEPRAKDLGVRVREVSASRIVLEAPTPRPDIGHPGTLGLRWDDGYGRLGDVTDVEGTRFIRSYEPVQGTPPICFGELADCPPVEIDPFAFPHDPGDVGLDFRSMIYESPVGRLGAWLVPASGSDRWSIHCHGWTTDRRELIRMLPAFNTAGFTSMVIDYRNDPGAPLDPTGRYRFGLSEWEDVEAAVQTAVDHGAAEVVLSGCSTGGALVMAFLETSPLAGRVSAVVLDSPNIVLSEAIRLAARDVRASRLMIEFGMWVADLRWGIDWDRTNYVQRADRILRVPTLVFHGTADQVVPISVSRQLEVRVRGLVDLVETPAAGHVMSWNSDPARYEGYLKTFLNRIG